MTHDWQATGRSEFVTIETTNGSAGTVRRLYVRCRCGATGFRRWIVGRHLSPVVYAFENGNDCR